MKKTLAKNFTAVEVSVDEFTAVFKCLDKEALGKWTMDTALYVLEVERFISSLSKGLRLELMGGLERSTPHTGYDVGMATNDGSASVRVSYHSKRPTQGVCIRFGGKGLKSYMSVMGFTTSDVIALINEQAEKLKWSVSFTRLDIALDILNGTWTVGGIDSKLEKGLWELRRRFKRNSRGQWVPGKLAVSMKTRNAIVNSNGMGTVYYGNREATFLRVYNKKEEQLSGNSDPMFRNKAEDCDSWVRFEAVFRKKDADACAKHIAELYKKADETNVFLGLFVDRFNLFNVSTQSYVGWWQKITAGEIVGPAKAPKEDTDSWRNLDRSKDYFANGNSGLMTLLKKIEHEAMRNGDEKPEEAILNYLGDVFESYQSAENKDTAGVIAWKRRYDINLEAERNKEKNEAG